MIRVVVVENSSRTTGVLARVLSAASGLSVVGVASNGEQAIELVRVKHPDIVAMDMHVSGIDGLQATRRIMETCPTPIVVVSDTCEASQVSFTFRAIEAGALAVSARPKEVGHPDHERSVRELIRTLTLMSEVRVVRRWRSAAQPALSPRLEGNTTAAVVAIGASTGGPMAVKTILSKLQPAFPVPIMLVQHIANGFVGGMIDWFRSDCAIRIVVAEDRQGLEPGVVYVAPDDCHMGVALDRRISLSAELPRTVLRPSVSFLFRSVLNVFGKSAVGVLLSGMGNDGSAELKLMRDQGCTTIAQDQESSVVFGMPGEAIQLNAAKFVLPPEKIGSTLEQLVRKPS